MLQQLVEDIIHDFQKKINDLTSELYAYLLKGNLAQFEEELDKQVKDLYNKLAWVFLCQAAQSEELKKKAQMIGQKKGLTALRAAEVTLQLKTGCIIKLFSWYAA